jgi:hypothetical protein
VEVVGGGAVDPDFVLGAVVSDGDGDGVFLDIEADMECSACIVWWSVCVVETNPNACPAACGDVRAALPSKATRDSRNGEHTAICNPVDKGVVRAVSHKV